MQLELDLRYTFSPEEYVLIERARCALKDVDFFFDEHVEGVEKRHQVLTALVYPNPLRLDFMAQVPEEIGQAFIIEPQEPLVPDLFEGDKLSQAFSARLEQAVESYFEYLCEEN